MKWENGKPDTNFDVTSARYCFVENLYSQGKMADCEYAVLSEWFNYLVTCPDLDFHTDLIVYLRTDPEVAHGRVVARSRAEEADRIPLQYLRDLHELHEDWLVRKTKFQVQSFIFELTIWQTVYEVIFRSPCRPPSW